MLTCGRVVHTDCPTCYDWVQRQVRVVRSQLVTLTDVIAYVMSRPAPMNETDDEFVDQLTAVNDTVQQLLNDSSVYGNFRRPVSLPCTLRCVDI